MLGPFRLLPPESKEDLKLLRRRLPSVNTPEEFERSQINERVFGKQYTVYINDEQKQFLEYTTEDGAHKRNTTQVFLSDWTLNACTCHEFATNKLGYCEHVAVAFLQNFRYITSNMGLLSAFHVRIRKLQGSWKYFEGQKYRVWSAKTDNVIVIGNKREPVDAVGVNNQVIADDYVNRFNTRLAELKAATVTSAGLLNEKKLYDYQEDIFLKMLAAKRCICSMIMGSGKTITSIATFAQLLRATNPEYKLLIVAPKSLKAQWTGEIKGEIGFDVYQIDSEPDIAKYMNSGAKIGAVTYQLIARYPELFSEMYHDMIIFDEMQFVRNNETKTWKALAKMKAEYILGLSGTIIENRLGDLYSVMEILAPGYLGPEWKFNADYQILQNVTKSVIHYRGTKNIDKLQVKLKPFVFSYNDLKITKLVDGKEEEAKINHVYHEVKLSPGERSIHDDYMEKANVLMAKGMNAPLTFGEKAILQSYLLKARQATDTRQLIDKHMTDISSGKLDALIKLVKQHRDAGEKLVIFSSWTEMLDIVDVHIHKRLKEVNTVFFTGKQSAKQRKANVKKFQTDPKCKVFLASDAGGLGLDGLQLIAKTVLHTELPWNPSKLDQRNARVFRIGQTEDVTAHYLIGIDTIETSIMGTLYDKRAIRQEVLYEEAKPKKEVVAFVPEKKEAKKLVKKIMKKMIPLF